MNELLEMLNTTPSYFGYFAFALVFLVAYYLIYTRVTRFSELELIRSGNIAAACHLTGSTLGFALPLYASIVHTATLQGFVFWALLALTAQIATYLFLKLLLKDTDRQIESDNIAYGILLGGISLVIGVINAACVV